MLLSPTLRAVAAALLLAALVATDALPVFPVSHQQCVMACCRLQGAITHGVACKLRPAGTPRCAVRSSDRLPVSFQSLREKAARPALRRAKPGEMLLAPAGWIAEGAVIAPPSPPFEPPVPPPRSLRFA